jgi:CubicO group peptidase (beta-lactamase class C family)
MKQLFLVVAFFASVFPFDAHSYRYPEVNPSMQAGGYVNFLRQRSLPASSSPLPLPKAEINEANRKIILQAEKLSANPSNLTVLLVEKGKIVYEKHNFPSWDSKPFHSFSMSKSLTAITIGNLYCDGKIANLDDAAGRYSTRLSGTVYGEASVKNLLTMSSGAANPTEGSGERKPKVWNSITQQAYSTQDYVSDFKERGRGLFGPAKSGSRFVYSNTDTLSLGFIAESNGGFVDNFYKYVWSNIGAESTGHWLVDRDGLPITYAGFNATARDWARLAMFSVKQLKSGNTCIRDFMKDATIPQISNSGEIARNFASYGYQIWIGNFGPRPSYWFVGYAGQRIGVDPETERIIVISSWKEDYMEEIYSLFSEWQKN